MKKDGFNDSFVGKHVHPDAAKQSLTVYDPAENQQAEYGDIQTRTLATAMASIFDWLHDTGLKTTDKRYVRAVALRTIAMTWVIDPKRMNGDSLRSIAKQLGGSGTRTTLANLSAEFSRKFKMRNKFKNHDWKN